MTSPGVLLKVVERTSTSPVQNLDKKVLNQVKSDLLIQNLLTKKEGVYSVPVLRVGTVMMPQILKEDAANLGVIIII